MIKKLFSISWNESFVVFMFSEYFSPCPFPFILFSNSEKNTCSYYFQSPDRIIKFLINAFSPDLIKKFMKVTCWKIKYNSSLCQIGYISDSLQNSVTQNIFRPLRATNVNINLPVFLPSIPYYYY